MIKREPHWKIHGLKIEYPYGHAGITFATLLYSTLLFFFFFFFLLFSSTSLLGSISKKAGPLRGQIIHQMKDKDLNSQNNMIPACAKSCNFLDCHPNSIMQMRLLPPNMRKRKNMKIGKKLKVFRY